MYMAIKHLPEISANLINAGRSVHEPVAVVSNATMPDMQVLETTLAVPQKMSRRGDRSACDHLCW